MRVSCGRVAGGARLARCWMVAGTTAFRSMWAASASVPVFTGHRSRPHAVVGGQVYDTAGAGVPGVPCAVPGATVGGWDTTAGVVTGAAVHAAHRAATAARA